MRLRALFFTALLFGAGCRPDVESQAPCGRFGDLSCPTGWHCDPSTAFCVAEENPPLVHFRELEPNAVLFGHLELEYSAVSALGLGSVYLVASDATGETMVELDSERIEGDGLNSGTWSAPFPTWWLNDGPAVIKAIAADHQGGTSEESIDVEIQNGTPVVSVVHTMETMPDTFEITVSVVSRVPISSLVAQVQGLDGSDQLVVVDYETNARLRGMATVTFEAKRSLEPTIVVFRASDVANRSGLAEAHIP